MATIAAPTRIWPRPSQTWTHLHQQLSEHPVFAGCSRNEIRRIVRWGEEVEVEPGETLLSEDRIGNWFGAILSGDLTMTRSGRRVSKLGPGDHIGAIAILGCGPQPATAVSSSRCRLFLIGRQRLISMTYLMPDIQQALLHTTDPLASQAEIRRLRAEGAKAWRRVSRSAFLTGQARAEIPASWRIRPSRSPATRRPWGGLVPRRLPGVPAKSFVTRVPTRAVAVPVGLVVASSLAAGLFLWHPPVAVLSPGTPIDVAVEVTVEGAPTYPVNGRYLLTPVNIDRPTLGGLLLAKVRGRPTVSVESSGADAGAARRLGLQAFIDGRQHAAVAAAEALGIQPSALRVEFRPHELTGPSAGLVYALALLDLLTPEDLAAGRTIAATGELTETGGVLPVAYVTIKADAARAKGAELFLVPPGQHPRRDDVVVIEVASLEDALEFLGVQAFRNSSSN